MTISIIFFNITIFHYKHNNKHKHKRTIKLNTYSIINEKLDKVKVYGSKA